MFTCRETAAERQQQQQGSQAGTFTKQHILVMPAQNGLFPAGLAMLQSTATPDAAAQLRQTLVKSKDARTTSHSSNVLTLQWCAP